MKKALLFVGLGLASCCSAILYAKIFSETGSQRLFITFYLGGVLMAASATGYLAFLALQKKSKAISVLSAFGSFAGVALLLISPFYVLH